MSSSTCHCMPARKKRKVDHAVVGISPTISSAAVSVVQLLQRDAPDEVTDLVLRFAGGRAVACLGRTNKFWRRATDRESLWESLCHALDKRPSLQSIVTTRPNWRASYGACMVVPQDIPTLPGAVRYCNAQFAQGLTTHMTILLEQHRTYELDQPLLVQAVGNRACLTIDTICPDLDHEEDDRACAGTCLSLAVQEDAKETMDTSDSMEEWEDLDSESASFSGSSSVASSTESDDLCSYQTTIVMDTVQPNQPLIQVASGTLDLKNARLMHCSPIGFLTKLKRSCNAAIMLEQDPTSTTTDYVSSSSLAEEDLSNVTTGTTATQVASTAADAVETTMDPPSLVLDNVTLVSYSGRGILNRHQAKVVMENSQVIRVC